MEYKHIVVTLLLLFSRSTVAAECETGWAAYKDELCIKGFPTLLSYQEAKNFCTGQSVEMAKASLVLVKEEDMQNLLVSYTNEMFDYIWLGSQYDEQASEFKWDDGEAFTYSNWEENYPHITNVSNACVELRPVNAKHEVSTGGKWADVNCQKRNLVICQRTLSWSLQDAVNEIIRNRKQHQEDIENLSNELERTKQILERTQENLATTTEQLLTISARVVPVGFIYIEYHNQPSPITLWPSLTWEDISSTYAGLFFRTSGGSSEDWGVTQTECAPRITQSQFTYFNSSGSVPHTITIPYSGWSEYVRAGYYQSTVYDWWGVNRYFSEGCEVRPRNLAMRIWKRTA